MSLRNRARAVQKASGLGYQQALAKLKAIGDRPAILSRTNHWPLARCDLFAIDPKLDPEWAALKSPDERRCDDCEIVFFAEKMARDRHCARCRRTPHERIDVLEVRPFTRLEILKVVCERLLMDANAQSVVLANETGRVIVQVGAAARHQGMLASAIVLRGHKMSEAQSMAIELDEDMKVCGMPVGKRGYLTVVFDQRSSLGLVQLRMRKAIEEIERLLADPLVGPFGGGDGGSGGNPAEMTDDVRRLRRKPS